MILNPKLLIVDDERGIVDMIQSYFQTQYDILTAYSGQEALKSSLQTRLNFIGHQYAGNGWSDCMPADTGTHSLSHSFLTARMESSDKIIGFQAGADDYIVKPFDLDELGRVLPHICAGSSDAKIIRQYASLVN